jgi:hypothetical protein
MNFIRFSRQSHHFFKRRAPPLCIGSRKSVVYGPAKERTNRMMDVSTMPAGMIVAMGIGCLIVLAFLVFGIAAFIKYLRS